MEALGEMGNPPKSARVDLVLAMDTATRMFVESLPGAGSCRIELLGSGRVQNTPSLRK